MILASPLGAGEKILICGVCQNIAKKLPFIMQAMTDCGKAYDDYRIIIYENNSKDYTGHMLRLWMKNDPKVIVLSENLTASELIEKCPSGNINRTDVIAMARNRTLKEAMRKSYDGFDYVIMADMDFGELWDIDAILATTSRKDIEWDGVFANGLLWDGRFYDVFAYRAEDHPMGPELLGNWWWHNHGWFTIPKEDPWVPVYSAFNGLAIYKRNSLKGSWYSGSVNLDVELAFRNWLEKAKEQDHPYIEAHEEIISQLPTHTLAEVTKKDGRQQLPETFGFVFEKGPSNIVWVNHHAKRKLPELCEHIALHASMANKGFGKLYINPSLITHYHE